MDASPFDYANLSNLAYLEELYTQYRKNPEQVDPSWQRFFEGMRFASELPKPAEGKAPSPSMHHLLDAYRIYGHLASRLSVFQPSSHVEELEASKLGFSDVEMAEDFPSCGLLDKEKAPLSAIIDALRSIYCNTIGYQYMHLENEELRAFIQKAVERPVRERFSKEEKRSIYIELMQAESFERFIHKNYQGQKRFSLEGGEPFIPMVKEIIAQTGAEQTILGMAHRGRLNTLANIFGKPYEALFFEFEPVYTPPFEHVSGDVKYHLGYSAEGLILMPNPSHLESINAPSEGMARALQDHSDDRRKIVPLLVHGDAAIAGQGVVYETLQMSRLAGYETGGTLHIVINNHIGFTARPEESRSTRYCSDIAKAFDAPVFHVNADDSEGCVFASRLAAQLRQRFGCDVFIELHCSRKYGHNEGDEPSFTNPAMYAILKEHKSPKELYEAQLIDKGVFSAEALEHEDDAFHKTLEEALAKAKEKAEHFTEKSVPPPEKNSEMPSTKISEEELVYLTNKITDIPNDFVLHKKIDRILLKGRRKMIEEKKGIDWGLAEHLAYASVLMQGRNVRLSGQDARRGTFSHRHAVLYDQESEREYIPLAHLDPNQGRFTVYNSHLSEFGVLGFEFGYTMGAPHDVVIWEAQYGDFANGAQLVIDQYITCSEQKWNVRSSLILLLPHGYEGGGPEHSSARIERYLQMAAGGNIRIAMPTSPAQLFHLIRRQALLEEKKPLIVFTPKALLRYGPSLSTLDALSEGAFQPILPDPSPPQNAHRAILCSGKVYYELINHRERMPNTAIHRIEQLYPIDTRALKALVEPYSELLWVQEEHSNMGAWEYIRSLLLDNLSDTVPITYCGRGRSASTAAGSSALHNKELEAFLEQAFEL